MSTQKAAEIFAHYIILAFDKVGDGLDPDCRRELADAVRAFAKLDQAAVEE